MTSSKGGSPGKAGAYYYLRNSELSDNKTIEAILASIGNGSPDSNTLYVYPTNLRDQGLGKLFDVAKQEFKFSTKNFKDIILVSERGKKTHVLERSTTPPWNWVSKLNACCVKSGIPPDEIAWDRLSSIKWNGGDAVFLSLFSDTKTTNLLKSLGGNKLVLGPEDLGSSTVENISKIISEQKLGAPVIIIGHAITDGFYIESIKEFIPYVKLLELVAAKKAPIFLIGCNTTNVIRASLKQDSAVVGTLNKIYPRDVLPAVFRAANEAATLKDFIERIATGDLPLWLPADFHTGLSVHATDALKIRLEPKLKSGEKGHHIDIYSHYNLPENDCQTGEEAQCEVN